MTVNEAIEHLTTLKEKGYGDVTVRCYTQDETMIYLPTLHDLIGDVDYTCAIPALPDEFVTWPGKDSGAPRPPIFWLDRDDLANGST